MKYTIMPRKRIGPRGGVGIVYMIFVGDSTEYILMSEFCKKHDLSYHLMVQLALERGLQFMAHTDISDIINRYLEDNPHADSSSQDPNSSG